MKWKQKHRYLHQMGHCVRIMAVSLQKHKANNSTVIRLGRALSGGDEEEEGLIQDIPKEGLKFWFLI